MGEWLSYFRSRALLLLFWAMTLSAPVLVSFLGGQSMDLAWYAAGVSGFLLALFLCVDGSRFCRRLRLLRALAERLEALPGGLPAPLDAMGAAYGELARRLYVQSAALTHTLERERNESLSYYTLWVHQIKTPIAAMRLVLQREGGGVGGVLQQELFKVEQYAELALKYVKLQDMAADLVVSHCDLNELVRQSVKKYALLFVYQGLRVDVGPLSKDVVSDPKWLCFVLEQIISNAAKYTRKGGLRIYMEGGRLALSDTGIGIRQEDLPRIFEKGYTGYNGRVDDRASGIGLFMAKQAADTLGIGLHAESEPGRGTRVFLRFPNADTFRFM